MHFSLLLTAFVTTLASSTRALNLDSQLGSAVVVNNCTAPIYVWSVDSAVSPQITLEAHQNYSQTFHHDPSSGGVAIKVTTIQNGIYKHAPQAIFAYDLENDLVWFELSDVFGDPFAGKRIQIRPPVPPIVWTRGLPSGGASQVMTHNATQDLIVTFC